MSTAAPVATSPVTARRADEFLARWNDECNFLLGPELIHFDMPMPAADEIVDRLRRSEKCKINFFDTEDDAEAQALCDRFRSAPLEQIIDLPYNLSHFDLNEFYGSGQFLEQFQQEVMIPWRTFLSSVGLTFMRCYPIIFISGKGRSSQYHVDVSHVLAWQVQGTKTFHGFHEPSKYGPIDDVVHHRHKYRSPLPPDGIDPADVLSCPMPPGAVLWNQLLTPHWVTGSDDEIAVSVNISHGGVQHRGQFSPREQVLRQRWQDHPDEAWLIDERY